MEKIKQLNVFYNGIRVGFLQPHDEYLTKFKYDAEWLTKGFSISPFSLPLKEQVFISKISPFDGLYGVFADSLPDGWGRLLVDRLLLKNGYNPHKLGVLNRLAIVGSSGMGALTYEPDQHFAIPTQNLDFDEIAVECSNILRTDYSDDLDELFKLGGSSGGARPKILTTIDGVDWIIKFPASEDSTDIGQQEYDYSLCAKACGLEMTETRLFPSKKCMGYFGTKRFDRKQNGSRIHMLSVSAFLETSHRIPNLDYDILMKLTMGICRNYLEVEKLYRLMCFNVFAHNRDDHSKNFTYLYNEDKQRWQLSPAYDLTYSYSLHGEHATTVHGNGSNPSLKDILAVGKGIGIEQQKAKEIAENVQSTVQDMLGKYLNHTFYYEK